MKRNTFRARIYAIVEPSASGAKLSTIFDASIISLIVLNVIALILESIPEIDTKWRREFEVFELISVIVFSIEYLLRLWSCVEEPRYSRPVTGRLHFMLTPMALVDFIAIVPFFMPFLGWDMRFVRTFRILRLARIAKLARYTTAVHRIKQVIFSKRDELFASVSFMAVLIVVSSCLLYFAEHDAQPEQFASIPATMWWSIVTLTTVGYGDIYPVTVVGKLLAALIALLGIGMVALPTSILGAGFVEEARSVRMSKKGTCEHCGYEINR